MERLTEPGVSVANAHSYRTAGNNKSISGTKNETSARLKKSPLGRFNPNWTKPVPSTTNQANINRPTQEFGVLRGSEIMKKAKSRSAPLCSRCHGMVQGSPSQADRLKSRSAYPTRNANGISARRARCTTSSPRHTKKNVSTMVEPHWPAEHQATRGPAKRRVTSPMFAGLKRCLPRKRKTNLLRIATAAATTAVAILSKLDRKSTRLNSSHQIISYAVFCLKKKK